MAGQKTKRWAMLSAAAMAALASRQQANAGSFYWVGDNGSTWNVNTGLFGSNWSNSLTLNNDPLALPGSGDDVFFFQQGSAASLNPVKSVLGQNFSIKSLTFLNSNNQPVTIDGGGVNSLTIGTGGISIFGGAYTNAISANVVLGANQTWANNGTTLTVSGGISGTSSLTTAGVGILNLTGANTFSGGLTLSTSGNGVTLAGAAGSATSISSLTLLGGSTLNLDSSTANHAGQNRLADNLAVNSSGGIFNLIGNGSVATTETVGTLNVGSGFTQVNVTGAVGSTLAFGSAVIPSMTRVTGGTLNFGTGGSIALPNQTLSNGIIGGWATIGNTRSTSSANVLDFATVSGGKVVPLASYQADFSSATNNTQINSTVDLANASVTVNSLYLTGNSILQFNGATTGATNTLVIASGGIISNAALGATGINNQPTLNAIALIGSVNASAGNANGPSFSGKITSGNGKDLIVTTASNLQINSIITDFVSGSTTTSIGLTKNGSGLLDLSDGNNQGQPSTAEIHNTYTGITTVNDGTILVNDDQNFGAVPTSFRANSLTLNGGTLLTTRGFAFSANRGITVGPQGGTLAYEGGATWNITQTITGPGGITFAAVPLGFAGGNTNTMTLGSTANSYQGPTVLNLQAPSGQSATITWNAADQIPDASAVTVIGNPGGGSINMNNVHETIGSLASATGIGKITNLGVFTTGNNNLSTNYGGSIAGGGTFTKVGTGVQTLSGALTYTGTTTVSGWHPTN